jgi:hypothetical protein
MRTRSGARSASLLLLLAEPVPFAIIVAVCRRLPSLAEMTTPQFAGVGLDAHRPPTRCTYSSSLPLAAAAAAAVCRRGSPSMRLGIAVGGQARAPCALLQNSSMAVQGRVALQLDAGRGCCSAAIQTTTTTTTTTAVAAAAAQTLRFARPPTRLSWRC